MPVIPAKAGISPPPGDFRRFAEWIPAFAGMTAAASAHVSRMSPLSSAEKRGVDSVQLIELSLRRWPKLGLRDVEVKVSAFFLIFARF